MPKAARISDIDSGHGCYPPSNIIEGSSDVYINGIPAARVGDALASHGCSNCAPHARKIIAGSKSVFVNGKPIARVGDAIDCGGVITTGSPDVIVGDDGI